MTSRYDSAKGSKPSFFGKSNYNVTKELFVPQNGELMEINRESPEIPLDNRSRRHTSSVESIFQPFFFSWRHTHRPVRVFQASWNPDNESFRSGVWGIKAFRRHRLAKGWSEAKRKQASVRGRGFRCSISKFTNIFHDAFFLFPVVFLLLYAFLLSNKTFLASTYIWLMPLMRGDEARWKIYSTFSSAFATSWNHAKFSDVFEIRMDLWTA